MVTAQVSFNGLSGLVYLPTNGDVKTVTKELETASRNVVGVRDKDSGDLAAEFIRLHTNNYNSCKLINTGLTSVDYTYSIDAATLSKNIYVRVYAGNRLLYSGSLEDVLAWTDASTQLRKTVDKIVRFVYKGGSGTRERLVKVTGVEGTGNGTIIRGWDVHKSKAGNPAYRCYRVGNIVGNVEVVG